ncbi:MAG TPA: hypothetical protein VG961_13595, partial [Ignavibacteria bacterium]|nr:hypothetical protein [Ignavibacteria bacterium]
NTLPLGPVLNLKAGYHLADKKSDGYASYGDNSIPGGITFELAGELPTGKGWYPGFSFEYATGNDAIYDYYAQGLVNRNIYYTSYIATVKKRIFIENSAFYIQTGLGKGTVTTEYGNSNGSNDDGVLSFIFRTGFEYVIGYRTLVSIEAGYLGMGQIMAENGRSNSIFLVKAGLGYVFK